ncbi:Vacuolar protein sorting-associated protein 62, partial [Dinochytrium kinnereticum]
LGKSTPLGRVGNHVGDWERFVVRTQNGQALSLDYNAHGGDGARVVPVNDRRVKWVDGHPVVYAALGSHGSWPTTGVNTYKTVALVYDLTDETADNGSQWQTWLNVKTIEYKRNGAYSGDESFMNYRGRYGNKGKTDCWFYDLTKLCMLADGPPGPNRRGLLEGPPAQTLATPGGDNSRMSFYLDPETSTNGFGFVGVHIYCPGTEIFGDSGDVERWGVVPVQNGNLAYTITTDRCRKGRERRVDRYEVALCTSSDPNSCSKRSGYRKIKVFNAGSETNALGVVVSDPDPWRF